MNIELVRRLALMGGVNINESELMKIVAPVVTEADDDGSAHIVGDGEMSVPPSEEGANDVVCSEDKIRASIADVAAQFSIAEDGTDPLESKTDEEIACITAALDQLRACLAPQQDPGEAALPPGDEQL